MGCALRSCSARRRPIPRILEAVAGPVIAAPVPPRVSSTPTDWVREFKIDFGPDYRLGEKILLARAMCMAKSSRAARPKTIPYDVAGQLRTSEEMAAYLDDWLEEAPMINLKACSKNCCSG